MANGKPSSDLTRYSLRLFIASVIATAAVGALALMFEPEGWWGQTQIRILCTSAILAGASVCGLVCSGCYSLGHRALPAVGMGFVLIATATGIACVWDLYGAGRLFDYEWLWKLNGVCIAMGVGCSHLAMLLLLKLHRSYRWMQGAAYFVILGLASFIALLIVTEGGGLDEMITIRVIGVWTIGATAISLILPVLAYLSRGKLDEEGESTDALQRRIAQLRSELERLEARLAELPPAAPTSPWDTGHTAELEP